MPPRPDAPPLPIRVNRAPVLTLWAAVVAEHLGHPEETALTLGAAVAGTAARAKARRLGLAEDRPEEDGHRPRGEATGGERHVVRLLGREIAVSRSDGGVLLAAHGDRPQSPASVRNYLARAFGDRLGEVRAVMDALAASLPPDELNRVGFRLYERFRPEVPEGVQGWGAKALLDIGRIKGAADWCGSLRASSSRVAPARRCARARRHDAARVRSRDPAKRPRRRRIRAPHLPGRHGRRRRTFRGPDALTGRGLRPARRADGRARRPRPVRRPVTTPLGPRRIARPRGPPNPRQTSSAPSASRPAKKHSRNASGRARARNRPPSAMPASAGASASSDAPAACNHRTREVLRDVGESLPEHRDRGSAKPGRRGKGWDGACGTALGDDGAASAQVALAPHSAAVGFDRAIFTTDNTALCPRQHQIAALRRALDDNDRAAFDRAARDGACKLVGPDIRLAVVARPGAYDPDVEVRVAGDAPPGRDGAGLPRGRVWTLKSVVRN